jgi:replicative DNA helicase
MLDKQLPEDLNAERAVLGAILINPPALDRIAPLVNVESFRKDAHREIFRALWQLAITGVEIDLLTLRDMLGASLQAVGGSAYISSLVDDIPDIANVERYAKIVQEKAALRRIIGSCQKASRNALEGAPSVEVVSGVLADLSSLGVAEGKESRGIYTVATEVRSEADRRASSGEMVGVQTGYPLLDEMTLGIPREGLSVLGARSSHGKTAFAINLTISALNVRPTTVAVLYSLEMSKQAITNSLQAKISGVPLPAIREWGSLNPFDRERALEAEGELARLNRRFFFADRISTISDLIADARKRKQETGLDLVLVDYLQLLEGVDESNRERTVNQIAWQLHELSRDLKCAVLALSQVTPAADQRKDGRLSIDDLRDSKAIGHHARLVLLLSRPWQSNKARTDVLACHTTLQVEKQSQGPTGDIVYHFAGATQDFREGLCGEGCRYERKFGFCQECARVGVMR